MVTLALRGADSWETVGSQAGGEGQGSFGLQAEVPFGWHDKSQGCVQLPSKVDDTLRLATGGLSGKSVYRVL